MLIGLTGCKGVGKNTAADFLDGYVQLAFADKLKEAVANLFDITIEEVDFYKTTDRVVFAGYVSLTWREFLQRFGTEMGRNTFGQDFWLDLLLPLEVVDSVHYEVHDWVVTDVRFPNEAVRIKLLGGVIIEITRPGHEPDGHASEAILPRDLIDAVVPNDSTVEIFSQRFLALVHGLHVGGVSERIR